MFPIVSCINSHLPGKFHENPFSRFSVMLLTDKQTDRQADKHTIPGNGQRWKHNLRHGGGKKNVKSSSISISWIISNVGRNYSAYHFLDIRLEFVFRLSLLSSKISTQTLLKYLPKRRPFTHSLDYILWRFSDTRTIMTFQNALLNTWPTKPCTMIVIRNSVVYHIQLIHHKVLSTKHEPYVWLLEYVLSGDGAMKQR